MHRLFVQARLERQRNLSSALLAPRRSKWPLPHTDCCSIGAAIMLQKLEIRNGSPAEQ